MKNVRMQFDLPEDRVIELESIMDKCGMGTKKELINNALTLLEWAVDEVEMGHDIASVDRSDKQFFALSMPILKAAKKKSIAS